MTRLPSNLVLGIAGNKQAGKDTMFGLLKSLDQRMLRMAFADQLKADLRDLCHSQFGIDPLTAEGSEKEFIRSILIAYGCAWRDRDVDHWADLIARRIEQNHRNNPQPLIHCITDFRFTSEVTLFRKRFGPSFKLVSLTRQGAPEPTDEEKKHWKAVAAMADYSIVWGGEAPEERLDKARELVKWLEDSAETP